MRFLLAQAKTASMTTVNIAFELTFSDNFAMLAIGLGIGLGHLIVMTVIAMHLAAIREDSVQQTQERCKSPPSNCQSQGQNTYHAMRGGTPTEKMLRKRARKSGPRVTRLMTAFQRPSLFPEPGTLGIEDSV